MGNHDLKKCLTIRTFTFEDKCRTPSRTWYFAFEDDTATEWRKVLWPRHTRVTSENLAEMNKKAVGQIVHAHPDVRDNVGATDGVFTLIKGRKRDEKGSDDNHDADYGWEVSYTCGNETLKKWLPNHELLLCP